ncbi:unnamed protein product [Rotaria sp. Silwood2]|nr:unnamed protein product [Rotaria sp. Silwood2]CAF2813709.1 unnamed protein product [Rotaria sp. Silwood2]CAF3271957.1 unnamed protein product [Rotaria sp. Silwood2]CAF4188634.1 unnamed protein product [Rotaria sp. Silwood2]CAF4318367.1 unnamed protein product [Rotaria sp. Silwood2]
MINFFHDDVLVNNITGFAVLSSLIIADDPCRYQDPKKGVLDLTSLGRTDGKAAYSDIIPPTGSNYKYSYNPCKPFTEEPTCKGVAVCQVSMDGKFSFSLGAQDSVKWNPGAGLGSSLTILYSAGEKKVTVTLQCVTDGTHELEALGEPSLNNYKFILSHKCACWDGCGGGPSPDTTTKSSGGSGSSGGISGGAVFIILLAILIFVYSSDFVI